jgi:hypothetical protein
MGDSINENFENVANLLLQLQSDLIKKTIEFDVLIDKEKRKTTMNFLKCLDIQKDFDFYVMDKKITEEELLELILDGHCLDMCVNLKTIDIKPAIKTILNRGDKRLNDANLKYINKYIKITELNASNNHMITNLNFCDELQYLDISNYKYMKNNEYKCKCGVDDNGIKELKKLKKLCIDDNPNITTLEQFSDTLEYLHACGNDCNINDDNLKCLNKLKTLDSWQNDKITYNLRLVESSSVLRDKKRNDENHDA